MTVLEYVDVRTGDVRDTVSWPGEGAPIDYATGRARPVVEGLLRRSGIRRADLAGWSNGYVQLRTP